MEPPAEHEEPAGTRLAGIAALIGPQRAGAVLRGSQVAMAFEAVGDRWTSLVQASAYCGLHRFGDIQAALEMPTNTLAGRLKRLVRAGSFDRIQYLDHPPRFEYRLTDRGRALYLAALTLHQWAGRWLLRGRAAPLRLWHRPCDSIVDGAVVCDHCWRELRPAEVEPRRPARRSLPRKRTTN